MGRAPDAWITRRSLFEGALFDIGYIACRPTPAIRHEVEYPDLNVVALPTAGVFALHQGPRRRVVATPNHAVFISSRKPYRVTFPGNIGDDCLTLRLTPQGLARLAPQSMSGDGFDGSTAASCAVLPSSAILARGLLWRWLARGHADPLFVEELAIGLLASTLPALRSRSAGRASLHVERVKEAISTSPERKWSLGELAGIAGVSPCHLAHLFNREVGTSVYRYTLRSRLAKALDAVLDSSLDLTSIALDTRFASHSHFTARFRAFFGLTPDALRRSAASREAAELHKIVTAHPAATT